MTMLTKYWASELYDPEAHKLRMPVPGDEVYLAADVEEVFVPLLQRVVGLAHIEERWRAEAQRLLERLR